MLKKIKENEYIQKFIELWNIPRYRALLKLGLYVIFFVFVIAYIKDSNSYKKIDNVSTNPLEIYSKMDNYQYIASIKNETTNTFRGRVNKNKQIIDIEENSYYYNGQKLYKKEDSYKEIENNLYDFDIWKFTPTLINNLIKEGKLDSKTTFTNGMESKKYSVSVPEFIKQYFNEITEDFENISITTYEENKKIVKVELDLTKIYHQKQYSNSYDYIVTLEYSLINQIPSFAINIESSD